MLTPRHVSAFTTVLLLALAGCEATDRLFGRVSDYSKSYWLPLTVEVRYDPAMANLVLDYTNACRQPQQLPIGPEVQKAFSKEIGLAFEKVRVVTAAADAPRSTGVNGTVDVSIGLKELQLHVTQQRARTYPATLTLGGTVMFTDEAGNVLFKKSMRTEQTEGVETGDKQCPIAGLPDLVIATAEKLARGYKDELGTSPKIRELAQNPEIGRRVAAVPVPVSTAP